MKKIIAAILALIVGSSFVFAGAGGGPRSFPLMPKDVNLLAVYGLSQRGDQLLNTGEYFPNADIDVNIGIVQYTRTFGVYGHLGAAFVALPYVDATGSVGGFSASNDGLGSIIVGGTIGLIGLPALSGKKFAEYNPGFQLGLVGKLFLPTGSYNSDNIINVGSNRLAGQIILPMTYVFGSSMIDPNLTTLEIQPSVTIYGDNDDPSGSASNSGQDELFTLEAHVTQSFTKSTWVSFGGIYNYGGETSTNSVWNDDRRESFGIGASVNFAATSSTAVKVSYGETVWRNDDGMDIKLFRILATYAF